MRHLARSAALLGLLALSFSPALGTPAPVYAASAATQFGAATYDAAHGAIVVPYTGAAPAPTLYTLTPTHHYYDVPGAQLQHTAVQYHAVGGAVERYTLANRSYGAVRLSFTLTTPGKPAFQVDATHHRLLVWPLGHGAHAVPVAAATPKPVVHPKPSPKPTATPKPKPTATPTAKPSVKPVAKPTAKPTAKPATTGVRIPSGLTPPSQSYALRTEVGKPYFDDFHHRLVLPYKGQEPDFNVVVYYKNPRWVYFDFSNAYVNVEGQRFQTFPGDTAFEGWMLSQRKGGLKTRLYLKLKNPTQIIAQVHEESHQIWLELPGHVTPAAAPVPAASPTAEAPAPEETPAQPETSPTP